MPWGLCALSLSIFAFIFSVIAMMADYFAGRGKWFIPLLGCAILSAAWMGLELYRDLAPPADTTPQLTLRPTTAL